MIGLGRAKRMILTGEIVDGKTACAIGLTDAAESDLLAAAEAAAAKVCRAGLQALARAKACLNASSQLTLEEGLTLELKQFGACFDGWEQREGMEAFLEKREARFR